MEGRGSKKLYQYLFSFIDKKKRKRERERENSIKFALQILNAFKYILNIMKKGNDATIIMIQMYT